MNTIEQRIKDVLNRLTLNPLSNTRNTFVAHLLVLFVGLRGRVNFLNMERYGVYSEKTYRRHFEQPLEWTTVSQGLIETVGSGRYVIASDASFVPKSGKQTPNVDSFWNGCVGKSMPGMEAHTIAIVDLELNIALHFHTQQTPGNLPNDETRTQQYVQHIIDHQAVLRQFSPYLVYDNAAANQPFIDRLLDDTDLHLVSKLRCDADLRYLYTGPRRPGAGAPRKYDGKITCAQPDLSRFDRCYDDDDIVVYTAVVNSKRLKRNIRIAYLLNTRRDRYVMLFSTDVTLSGALIYAYYRARFQIEFLFRDAKQYAGLTHCQARSEQKITFHLNASLTSVSLCRADFYANADNQDQSFSMSDYQTRYFNKLLLDQFMSRLDLDPMSEQIASVYHDLLDFGRIAA